MGSEKPFLGEAINFNNNNNGKRGCCCNWEKVDRIE